MANAHDHARFTRLSQSGSFDVPLEAWLPYLTLIPSVDPWLASAVSFGRSARGGSGSVMVHYTRVQGLTDFPTEAKAVAKAARDVGLRIALAVHCRDRNPIVYGSHDKLLYGLSTEACACVTRRFLRAPAAARDQIAMVEAVAAEIEGSGVTVQYGPAGVQWCTDEMLEGIAEASAPADAVCTCTSGNAGYQARRGRTALIRTASSVISTVSVWSTNGLRFAHCIWLRPDEMEIIAERGATIVSNTSSQSHCQFRHGAGRRDAASRLQGCHGPGRARLR